LKHVFSVPGEATSPHHTNTPPFDQRASPTETQPNESSEIKIHHLHTTTPRRLALPSWRRATPRNHANPRRLNRHPCPGRDPFEHRQFTAPKTIRTMVLLVGQVSRAAQSGSEEGRSWTTVNSSAQHRQGGLIEINDPNPQNRFRDCELAGQHCPPVGPAGPGSCRFAGEIRVIEQDRWTYP